jgi:hypothetical protein
MISHSVQLRRLSSLLFLFLLVAGCAHLVSSPATAPKPAFDRSVVTRSVVLCKTTEAELRHLYVVS